jgi:MFS family permease
MPRTRSFPALGGVEGNVTRLAALRFLCWMHLMSAVIIPFFREWGGLSFVQIFGLQTWFMLSSFLMEVPTGAVADRFGRKVSVALGGFLLATATLLYGAVPRLAVFVAAEALFAVAIALISGADEALAYDSLLASGREARRPPGSCRAWRRRSSRGSWWAHSAREATGARRWNPAGPRGVTRSRVSCVRGRAHGLARA